MPTNKHTLDKQDAQALFDLFRIVTGTDPNTVAMGSMNIVKVDGDEYLTIFHTIDPDDNDAPHKEHIVQIVPGHPIQEEI